MLEEKFLMFHNRLAKVHRHLGRQARRAGVSCYRIYDHDLPEFPFMVEIYGEHLYVAEYKRRHGMTEDAHEAWIVKSLDVLSEVTGIPREQIFLRLRQRKPGRLGQYKKQDEAKQEFVVEENGLKFIVNLSDYLDTGLFLDHRLTRQLVRGAAAGKKILNLFAYTGSFSVYAAAGGAERVVTVDLSNTYLQWASRNMALNGFTDPAVYSFVQADVIQYLDQPVAEQFDIIIIDPPTFSNSKRMNDILDIQRDHVSLLNHCIRALKPRGSVYFSTNFRKFILEKERLAVAELRDITRATTPFDFEGKPGKFCFLLTK